VQEHPETLDAPDQTDHADRRLTAGRAATCQLFVRNGQDAAKAAQEHQHGFEAALPQILSIVGSQPGSSSFNGQSQAAPPIPTATTAALSALLAQRLGVATSLTDKLVGGLQVGGPAGVDLVVRLADQVGLKAAGRNATVDLAAVAQYEPALTPEQTSQVMSLIYERCGPQLTPDQLASVAALTELGFGAGQQAAMDVIVNDLRGAPW
jgi:hypothetical protein